MERAYKSKYSSSKITAAQYSAELVCENIAIRDNEQLPVKFWRLPKWKKIFIRQVQLANTLIALYGEFEVIRVLNRERWVYSLAYKKLDKMLQEIVKTKAVSSEITKVEQLRKPYAKPNILEKLE